ncbi:MAG: DUF3047 domain-containing protein [Ideonella sp.]
MLAVLALLAGCATGSPDAADALATSGWARASSSPPADSRWTHLSFPGKRASRYAPQRKDGRDALMVSAVSSASMVRRQVRVEPEALGRLQFSWLVPGMIDAADMTRRESDDSPVRLILAFEGDRSTFSAKDAMLSELAEAITGEPLPYATLMYVWSNRRPIESVIINPRTSRIRKLVMETGPDKVGRWLNYERDVRADFVKAYGEQPGALLSIGLMTDTDNTRSEASAWYGPVRMLPAQ